MKYGFGIDLGGTTVKMAYFNEAGNLLDKWEIPTNVCDNGNNILADIAAAIAGYLEKNHIEKEDILGIGIGVPGPVEKSGIVNQCSNLGWGQFNVEKNLSDLTGLPVKAGNDASLAALGEYWKGSGSDYENLVFVTLGTGVGGGIVIGGKVIHGAHGACGELGHIVLNQQETTACTCGKYGCAEQYCSATGIVRTARRYLNRDLRPSVLRQIPKLTCKDIFDAGNAGDAVAADILEIVYDQMAEFLADICCVLDPEAIVIGGGVSKAGNVLLEGIQRHLHKYIFYASSGITFSLASLGNDAGAYGAFKLALDTFQ